MQKLPATMPPKRLLSIYVNPAGNPTLVSRIQCSVRTFEDFIERLKAHFKLIDVYSVIDVRSGTLQTRASHSVYRATL